MTRELERITTIGVMGAGQMGRGIAHVCAAAGYRVVLVDVAAAVLDATMANIRAGLERGVERGSLSHAQAQHAWGLIHPQTEPRALQRTELVIEAIPEDEALKRQAFDMLGRICRQDAVLASNTSSISIATLARAAGCPERVIGMHFMNPVPVMALVEIVRTSETSEDTVALIRALAAKLGKVPVIAQDAPGFIVNRILMPMLNEAIFALEAGVASAEDIDRAMVTGVNHPVGPLALADRIGLDTVLAICEVLHRDLQDEKFRPCPLLRRYIEGGRLGRKSGRGFYVYESPGDRPAAMKQTA